MFDIGLIKSDVITMSKATPACDVDTNVYKNFTNEPRHEISNNVECGTSKASDQHVHMRSLIRTLQVASR